MPSQLRGASADALAGLIEKLGQVVEAGADAARVADDLFGVSDVLRREPALRRVATDLSVTPEAKADLVRGIAPSPALGGQRGEKLVHDGAAVAPGALLIGGTVVGRGAEIGAGARLDGAVIFDGACIGAGAVIERSIIGFGARIGPRALIRDGVIGDGADIGARCELLRGARVWPGVSIPDGGIRYSSDV